MISLIVATCNRVTELERLLISLDAQTYKNFEVLVVDQNPDDRLVPVLQRHAGLVVRHLRSELGLSRARNVGLRAAAGQVVAFPDDDCWYPGRLLADIVRWLDAHAEFDGLITGIRNANDEVMAPKFPPHPGACNRKSIVGCAVSFNVFLRDRMVKTVGAFNENLGLGSSSPYQSGEDVDYMIRCVDGGSRVCYQPLFTVYHPEFNSKERLRAKTYSYALSVGYVWRLHGYSWWWFLGDVVMRSFGGAAVRLCKRDMEGARVYVLRAKGQLLGYFLEQKRLTNSAEPRSMGANSP